MSTTTWAPLFSTEHDPETRRYFDAAQRLVEDLWPEVYAVLCEREDDLVRVTLDPMGWDGDPKVIEIPFEILDTHLFMFPEGSPST